jgi:hypothetical protein
MSESHKKQLETQLWNDNPAAKAAGYKMLDASLATATSRCELPTAPIYHLVTPRFSGGRHVRQATHVPASHGPHLSSCNPSLQRGETREAGHICASSHGPHLSSCNPSLQRGAARRGETRRRNARRLGYIIH